MDNYLELKFRTDMKKTLTLKIKKVRTDLNTTAVQPLINYVLTKTELFATGAGVIEECISAKVVSKDVTHIEI